MGPDGNLLAVLNEQTGPSVVRIDAQTGRIVFELADDGLLDLASEIAVEHNGAVVVAMGGQSSGSIRLTAPSAS